MEEPHTIEPATPIASPDRESRRSRAFSTILAVAIACSYWFFLTSFLAPAPGRPGIDENAYLVGGRNIATHGTTGFKPTDDYQFVGAMWLRSASGWYYPKYGFGLPLLNAMPVLLSRPQWAFGISPLCAALAVFGLFMLARDVVGSSFYALLAMIALAMGPATLQLADLPNSHAPALCFVVWGMFFLFRWWRGGRWPLGVLAGLTLGYAVTIRYTEALLLFPLYSLAHANPDQFIGPKLIPFLRVLGFLPVGPLGIAALSRVQHWKSWRSWLNAAVPVFAWALPVGTLMLFNWFTLGHITGYDDTNESSGFSIAYFLSKWSFATHQVYVFGLFILAPLGVAGLIQMFGRATRGTAVLLTLWFLPGALTYTAYYWGNNLPSIGFLRFFLTLFPPLIVAAMWLLHRTGGAVVGKRALASPLAAGALTAIAAAVGLTGSLGELNRQHRGTLNLHFSAERILAHLTRSNDRAGKPMVLVDTGLFPQLLQYLQFMADADWYAADVFSPRSGGGFGAAAMFLKMGATSPSAPVPLQQSRIDYIDSVRKGKRDADFVRDEHALIDKALSAGRKVYVVIPSAQLAAFQRRDVAGAFQADELERWVEPCSVPFPPPGERDWLTLPVWGDDPMIPWHPQSRVMLEIRRLPTTQPATSPAATQQSST